MTRRFHRAGRKMRELAAAAANKLVETDTQRLGANVSLMNCKICKRLLNNPDDPLSGDCGGDCWGCIGAIEAEMGYEPSLEMVREEAARGLRPGWVEPKKEEDRS